MKKSVWIILTMIFFLCAVGFAYTFLQPRFPASVVSVGRAGTVTKHTKHGTRSHTVIPLIVQYTDPSGELKTAEVNFSRPNEPIEVGQEIVITQSFNGWIVYPFTGLRMFCGFVGAGIGLFLLFMLMDRKKTPALSQTDREGSS